MPGNSTSQYVITREAIDILLAALRKRGFVVLGPTQKGTAIIYDELETSSDLPIGMTAKEAPASYKLMKRNDDAYFGYAVGPYSWKRFLYPSSLLLFKAHKKEKGFEVISENRAEFNAPQIQNKPEATSAQQELPKYAFFGVRACELSAIEIQDKIFMGGQYVDPYYKSVREQAFIVAVNCTEAGETCFCVSMKTGPEVQRGYDLLLTEVVSKKEHYFVVKSGSEAGNSVLKELPTQPVTEAHITAVRDGIEKASKSMGRVLDTTNLKKILYENFEHSRWDEVAKRCLSCANCTMVCPTCFCSTVEDVTDLTGAHAERWRVWDSCFTMEFSYIHGGSIRSSEKSRYRQWMTHKLASWIDQFGTSGCIGCGRCITWCPVGIDITEEAQAIRNSQQLPIAV